MTIDDRPLYMTVERAATASPIGRSKPDETAFVEHTAQVADSVDRCDTPGGDIEDLRQPDAIGTTSDQTPTTGTTVRDGHPLLTHGWTA